MRNGWFFNDLNDTRLKNDTFANKDLAPVK